MATPLPSLMSVLLLCAVLRGADTARAPSRPLHIHGDQPHTYTADTRAFPTPPGGPEDKDFWNADAQSELASTLNIVENTNMAKNVILFLGDGMGIPTVTAARIYKGQSVMGVSGEEQQLVFEGFPNSALSKTYCVDKQVADSACTGTAYLTGVKTNYKILGLDSSVQSGDCSTMTEESKVDSIAKWALDAGMRAGFVTSTRVTHATPGATYCHSAHRDWECDQEITPEMQEQCPEFKDIARQLVEDEPGKSFNVIMGGGYQYLVANATDLPADPVDPGHCIREDGRDLYQQWQDDKSNAGKSYEAVRTKSELDALDLTRVEHLLGIFANYHIPWEHTKREQNLDLPTLAEMTRRAIEVLQQGENGFFLLVEGGRIDHAHHDNTARRALDETLAFEDAVVAAIDMVGLDETLIVVTADHSHVMTINGYPERGQDILGVAGMGADDLPYTTLMYTTGDGFNYTSYNDTYGSRWDITGVNTTGFEYLQLAAVPRGSETHGGEDVAIYATGPMSHLFRGVHQQNYIAHAMGYAACIGLNTDHCGAGGRRGISGSGALSPGHWLLAVMAVLLQAARAIPVLA